MDKHNHPWWKWRIPSSHTLRTQLDYTPVAKPTSEDVTSVEVGGHAVHAITRESGPREFSSREAVPRELASPASSERAVTAHIATNRLYDPISDISEQLDNAACYVSFNLASGPSTDMQSDGHQSRLSPNGSSNGLSSMGSSMVRRDSADVSHDDEGNIVSSMQEERSVTAQMSEVTTPNSEQLFMEGKICASKGEHQAAIIKFRAAAELDQEKWEYTFYLSQSQAALQGITKSAYKESCDNMTTSSSTRFVTIAESNEDNVDVGSSPIIHSIKHTLSNSSDVFVDDPMAVRVRDKDVSAKDMASISYQHGQIYVRAGNYKKAIECYQEAQKLDNTKPEYCNNIAFSYYMLGNLEFAEYWCKQVLYVHPSYSPAHDTLAYIYKAKASKSREKGDDVEAERYMSIAIKEFHISKNNEKAVRDSKELYKSYIKLGATLAESGNIAEASKYFKKAELCLKKQQVKIPKDCTNTMILQNSEHHDDAVQTLQEFKSFIGDTPKHTMASKFTRSLSARNKAEVAGAPISKENIQLVQKAADIFMLGGPSKAIKDLRKEMVALNMQMAEKVAKADVSMAIVQNSHLAHVAHQDAAIDAKSEFKNYSQAFRSFLSITYVSAQAVEGGQVSLDTDDLLSKGVATALSFIPLCGAALSEITEIGANLYNAAKIHHNAKLFLKIAATITEFEEIITQVARDITLHSHKSAEILAPHVETKVTGLIHKIMSKCKAVKASVDKAIDGGELYSTHHAKLGVQNALEAVEAFLKYASQLSHFCDKHEAIKCLKHAVIPEIHWSILQTDIHTTQVDVSTEHIHIMHHDTYVTLSGVTYSEV